MPGVVNRTRLVERLTLRRVGGRLVGSPVRGFEQRVFGGHLLGQVVLAAGRVVASVAQHGIVLDG